MDLVQVGEACVRGQVGPGPDHAPDGLLGVVVAAQLHESVDLDADRPGVAAGRRFRALAELERLSEPVTGQLDGTEADDQFDVVGLGVEDRREGPLGPVEDREVGGLARLLDGLHPDLAEAIGVDRCDAGSIGVDRCDAGSIGRCCGRRASDEADRKEGDRAERRRAARTGLGARGPGHRRGSCGSRHVRVEARGGAGREPAPPRRGQGVLIVTCTALGTPHRSSPGGPRRDRGRTS